MEGVKRSCPNGRGIDSKKKDMLTLSYFLISVLAQGGPVEAATVENPDYTRWSSFKPGSWVIFEQPCGNGALLWEKYKLLELSKDQAVFECTKVENGFKYPVFQAVTLGKLPVRDPLGAVAQKPDGGEIEYQGPGGKQKSLWRRNAEGDEEIEVVGRKLQCHWIKMEYQVESTIEWVKDKSSTKTWYSKEIPGQVAKIEMTRWIKDDPPHDLTVVRVVKSWRIE
jgi:hypothetical protein